MSSHSADPIQDLASWRAHLFRKVVRISILAALLTCLPGLVVNIAEQNWSLVATGTGTLVWLSYVYLARFGDTKRLVTQLILMFYAIGLVILSTFGYVAYMYFMALPALAVIFISNRAALACSIINAVTLLVGGYIFQVDAGLPVPTDFSNTRFLVFTFSFVFISGILTWACGMLLDGAKRLMEIQAENTKVLELLVMQDPLTQLANRRMLQQGLAQKIARSKRNGQPFAVALIDLDRFKEINDKYGHESGDELLKAVASRIQQIVRSGDMVVRLGGDEFVVLFHHYEGEAVFQSVLMRLLNKTSGEYIVNEQVLTIGVSIGVAVYPHDGADQQTLLKNADIALYQAKAAGRNSYRFYSNLGDPPYGA